MKITLLKKEKNSFFGTIVCLVCFLSNLSQMPFLVESALTRFIAIPVWVVLAGACLMMDTRIKVGATRSVWIAAVIFVLYYLISRVFNNDYARSELPYPIVLSMFVLFVGLLAGQHLRADDIKRIGKYYMVSGVIVCVNVFFTYIYGNSISGPSYLYASKNSVSQIILTAWMLILLFQFNGGLFRKLFWTVVLAFMTWTLISLKSRATLIAIPILVLWYVFNGNLNKRVRNIVVLLLAVFIVLLFNDRFYDTIVNQVIYSGRDSTSMEAVTSGRSNEWSNFPADFSEVWLFGAGKMKRESLILTALLEYGVLGGGTILFLAVSPLLWSFKYQGKNHLYYLLFTSVAIAYVANSIFEQMAPFGPGVKCYFLWFLFGLLESQRTSSLCENAFLQNGEGRTYAQ